MVSQKIIDQTGKSSYTSKIIDSRQEIQSGSDNVKEKLYLLENQNSTLNREIEDKGT